MAKKRLTLPKNFKDLVEAGDIEGMKKVFETCEINAYQGYDKDPALSLYGIPDELVIWLVGQGADINRPDATYQRTPLHQHAMRRSGRLRVFLEHGADVHALDRYGDTPLHFAAGSSFNVDGVKDLVHHGADVLARNQRGLTPLESAMTRANNIDIPNLVEIAVLLLERGDQVSDIMGTSVSRIGKNFEFHRDNFNKDYVAPVSEALLKLYELFAVVPVERRIVHDGVSPVVVGPGDELEQHDVLWKFLVPSRGPAGIVQGEVIRISGKVADELYRNGGGNWDADYRKMMQSLGAYFRMGHALPADLLAEADQAIAYIKKSGDGDEEIRMLSLFAVKWVKLNPQPIPLPAPAYDR